MELAGLEPATSWVRCGASVAGKTLVCREFARIRPGVSVGNAYGMRRIGADSGTQDAECLNGLPIVGALGYGGNVSDVPARLPAAEVATSDAYRELIGTPLRTSAAARAVLETVAA